MQEVMNLALDQYLKPLYPDGYPVTEEAIPVRGTALPGEPPPPAPPVWPAHRASTSTLVFPDPKPKAANG